ncbi:MAG: hypothetical protein M3Q65_24125 [Chloroflexota bacterium]|nr:hypothetical protein [Chloroflexota bacterium]
MTRVQTRGDEKTAMPAAPRETRPRQAAAGPPPAKSSRRWPGPTTAGGWFLLGSGLLTCPCHLPVTLGVLSTLLAGTAAGAFLAANTLLLGLAIAAYSVLALALGWHLLRQLPRERHVRDHWSRVPACPRTGGAGGEQGDEVMR